MAVTAPVSLTKIKTEFSGPNEFSAYVRGGTYVPDIPANSAISTTTTGLEMSQFLNASNLTVQLEDFNPGGGYDINASMTYIIGAFGDFDTAAAAVVLEFSSAGTYVIQTLSGNSGCGGGPGVDSTDTFTWLLAGNASDYSFRFERTSGEANFTSGDSVDTTYNLGSNPPSYELCTDAAFGASSSKTITGVLKILDGSSNVLVSKTMSIQVDAANSD
jgi:hypothetical protein